MLTTQQSNDFFEIEKEIPQADLPYFLPYLKYFVQDPMGCQPFVINLLQEKRHFTSMDIYKQRQNEIHTQGKIFYLD